jgi:hypothetical protein
MKKINWKISLLVLAILAISSLLVVDLKDSNKKSDSTDETQPTTVELKSVEDGPDYLKLEQVHPQAIARFLLYCFDERMYWNAGIVTTPELSASVLKQATKNYLEIDDEQVLIALGSTGAKTVDSTLWIMRPLDSAQVAALKNATSLGAWTENGGDFRWGAFMHIGNVRGEIKSYVDNCKK